MKDFPTLAFHASITNPFGKNALLNLLRQISTLLKERKHVTVGMVGYPNVGTSSVINTMKRKKVCNAAPTPSETKVWQYIAISDFLSGTGVSVTVLPEKPESFSFPKRVLTCDLDLATNT